MRTPLAHRWRLPVLAVTAGAALAACGTIPGVPGTGVPSSSAEPPMDLHGAPRVAHPLNLARYLKDPCSVISSGQLQQLGAKYSLGTKAASDSSAATLAACEYTSPNLDPNTSQGNVGFLTGGAGLSALYWSQQTDHTFTVFEPLTIEGYPAVNRVAKGESQNCEIVVGVTDRVGVSVDYTPVDPNVPRSQLCQAAQAMAMAVVQTMKSNQ